MKQLLVHNKYILSFLLILSNLICHSQIKDELINPSKNFKNDSIEVVNILKEIDSLYNSENYSKAIELSKKAIPFCENLGLYNYVAELNTTIGSIYRINEEYVKALESLSQALVYFKDVNNVRRTASVQNQIGAIYRLQGKYPTALEYYFNSLKNYQSIDYKPGISTIFNNIGIVYLYQKDYDKALEYYFKSLKIEEELKSEEGISISYLNIGGAYQKKKEYAKAIDYYFKSLELSKNINDLDAIGVNYNEIGAIYTELNNLTQAKDFLDQALQTFTKLGSKSRQAECHIYFGQFYVKSNNTELAIKHFMIASKLAKETGSMEFYANANLELSKIYEKIRIPTEALMHYKTYIASRDSLFNEENTKQSVQAEMLYQFEKHQEELRIEQAKKDALFEEKSNRQNQFRNFLITILFLLTILVGFIYSAYRSKRKANITLANQQNEILEKNEELLQQQEEILAQRDEIEKKNLILERSKQIISAKNERIISSIEYAQTIQQAILPHEEDLNKFFDDHFIVFMPKDIVSGDFYWFSASKDYVFAAVIDCTGHGVPGSFMSLIGNTLLNQIVNEWHTNDPALILEYLHQKVRKALQQSETHSKSHASMDICLVRINIKDRKITFAGASRPLYIVRDGQMEKIPGDPKSVGGFQREAKRYFTNHEITLDGPSYLYLTTDGFIDQMNSEKKKFGPRKLSSMFLENHERPMQNQRDLLVNTLELFKQEEEQIDDICILGLKI
ncbi:MAG: tetratricopeptide repeat protein [Tenuifilaceae bacterium]